MTHLQKRIEFTADLGPLIARATELGLDMVLCEALRSPEAARWNAEHCRQRRGMKRCEQTKDAHPHTVPHAFRPIGIINSLHVSGLAVDFLVMKNGAIVNDVEPYKLLGEFWKGLREGNAWGGDFQNFPDLGHFSREHDGRK